MRRLLLALISGAFVLAGCDSAESRRVEETQAALVGTWLRESQSGLIKSRRVLYLGADGKFAERLVTREEGGNAAGIEYAGEWSYDGIHLKRRFLAENGRQYSGGRIRFATFPLLSSSRSEFVVDDNIVGEKVSYRRVAEGTQP